MLFRDGLQIIQGVVRVGASASRFTSAIRTPDRVASPVRENFEADANINGESMPVSYSEVPASNPRVVALKNEAGVRTNTANGYANGSTEHVNGIETPIQISARPAIIGSKTQAELPSVKRDDGVCEDMVRWVEKLPLETLVLVEGRVQSPVEDSQGEQNVVRSGNVHNAEIEVYRVR